MAPLLSLDRLTVAFPIDSRRLSVVRDLSLDLDRGEILGLVGESGCGKTLTALAILDLVPPPGRIHRGRICLSGDETNGADSTVARCRRGGRIGLVFQEPASALDPLFRLGSQLEETILVHRPRSRRQARREALALLERVALPDPERVAAAFPHQLSGGQQQRAAIALALAGGPDVLIADEPTTALDVTIQAQILGLLDQLRRELGLAILLISHDLAVVAQICDRVAVLYAGELVEEGPVERLFRQPSHPYTRALLAALPRLGEPDRRVATLAGRVPTADRLPGGCAFHPRCAEAATECSRRRPDLVTVAPGQRARCLLVESAAPGAREAT